MLSAYVRENLGTGECLSERLIRRNRHQSKTQIPTCRVDSPSCVTPREDVTERAQEPVLGKGRHNCEFFRDSALDVDWRFFSRRIVAVVKLHVQLTDKRVVHRGGG